jgi:imidazole glycerol-phosphate synthase subunit HisH
MIVVVDYNMGNFGSILNMFKKIGVPAIYSNKKADIEAADLIILPGVGAFDTGIRNLQELDIIDLLSKKVLVEKTPILGICIGMQLMTKQSEEGKLPGLGWIDADVKKFRFENSTIKQRVPCIGWNIVKPIKENNYLSTAQEHRFYFVHSYYVDCKNPTDKLATAKYGFEYTAAFARDNIIGVQFHPEKSHQFGLKFFRNVVDMFIPSNEKLSSLKA